MLDSISSLLEWAGVNPSFADLCITRDEIIAATRDPLSSIGIHTLTHPRLAKYSGAFVRREPRETRESIEGRIGRRADHLAYPFGDMASAGRREFDIARQCSFATVVTTRLGALFLGHHDHLTALPRRVVHGAWQDRSSFETLLSGAPFALWNLGRRVSAT